jgi:acyl-coenzyme A synthetase/AMP-(fatty) acid ligase
VTISHENALAFTRWARARFDVGPSDRAAGVAPFHFDLSTFDLYSTLEGGGTVVLIPEDVALFPAALAAHLESRAPTILYLTPSTIAGMLARGDLASKRFPALRLLLFAGEVFQPRHLSAFMSAFPGVRLSNLYGPTETNVCTYYEVPRELRWSDSETLPIGSKCSGDELRIVDLDGSEVPRGQEGELLACGGSIMLGYWNRPEQTEKSFVVDEEGKRWYRTGDVVADEGGGSLRFLGRRDRMVKRRGYRVELGEIESALYRHPHVAEAATVALPDPESGVLIKAFLSWSGGSPPSMIELKQFCASNLPQYMVPDRFELLHELPKTSTDKVDYQTLVRRG